jgi:hypothetical protein
MLHRLSRGSEQAVTETHDPVGASIEPDGSPIVFVAGSDRPNE